ncbi:MAG: hypothetical protein ACJ75J_02465, partial [Cytophagaceae bacterium]
PLENVFAKIYEKYKNNLKVDAKSDPAALKAFLGEIVPDFDTERVYNSDIKKLVTWYVLLSSHLPEVFKAAPEEKKAEEKEKPKKESATAESEKVKTEKAVKPEAKEEKKPAAKSKTPSKTK